MYFEASKKHLIKFNFNPDRFDLRSQSFQKSVCIKKVV